MKPFWEYDLRLTFWEECDLEPRPCSAVFVLPGTMKDYVDPERDLNELWLKLLDQTPGQLIQQRFEMIRGFESSHYYHSWKAMSSLHYMTHVQANFLHVLPLQPWTPMPHRAFECFVFWVCRYFDEFNQVQAF